MKIGPKYKICRRLGSRVFGKCQTTKFSIAGSERRRGPGRGVFRKARRGGSEYGLQLIEKQKARYTYGLKERQFANYVTRARRSGGNPAARLYQVLESRLDNVVFRLGLAPTRLAARQLVTHGHIAVNGRRVNIPSYQIKTGDKITIKPSSADLLVFQNLPAGAKEFQPPQWLSIDAAAKLGEVSAAPLWGETESDLNFSAILEFYGRV